jgi:hypothetical protein
MLECLERRATFFVKGNDLAVKNYGLGGDTRSGSRDVV